MYYIYGRFSGSCQLPMSASSEFLPSVTQLESSVKIASLVYTVSLNPHLQFSIGTAACLLFSKWAVECWLDFFKYLKVNEKLTALTFEIALSSSVCDSACLPAMFLKLLHQGTFIQLYDLPSAQRASTGQAYFPLCGWTTLWMSSPSTFFPLTTVTQLCSQTHTPRTCLMTLLLYFESYALIWNSPLIHWLFFVFLSPRAQPQGPVHARQALYPELLSASVPISLPACTSF